MYAYTAVTLISEVEHLDAFIKHNQLRLNSYA